MTFDTAGCSQYLPNARNNGIWHFIAPVLIIIITDNQLLSY